MVSKHKKGHVSTGDDTRPWDVIFELDRNDEEDLRISRFIPGIKKQLAAWS